MKFWAFWNTKLSIYNTVYLLLIRSYLPLSAQFFILCVVGRYSIHLYFRIRLSSFVSNFISSFSNTFFNIHEHLLLVFQNSFQNFRVSNTILTMAFHSRKSYLRISNPVMKTFHFSIFTQSYK